jgi:Uma2 family endonuclease
MSISMDRYRFSVDDYERMGEVGILGEDPRVELIHGEIVHMSPMYAPHISCLNRLIRSATSQTSHDYYVQIQCPIRIPSLRSEPEPDLAILRAAYDEGKPPEVPDILLVGEVSDSTLETDRRVKLPLYAAASIPEAWLFNLVAVRIERHTDPQPDGYRTIAYAESGQRLASTVLPDLVFDTDELIAGHTRN